MFVETQIPGISPKPWSLGNLHFYVIVCHLISDARIWPLSCWLVLLCWVGLSGIYPESSCLSNWHQHPLKWMYMCKNVQGCSLEFAPLLLTRLIGSLSTLRRTWFLAAQLVSVSSLVSWWTCSSDSSKLEPHFPEFPPLHSFCVAWASWDPLCETWKARSAPVTMS